MKFNLLQCLMLNSYSATDITFLDEVYTRKSKENFKIGHYKYFALNTKKIKFTDEICRLNFKGVKI